MIYATNAKMKTNERGLQGIARQLVHIVTQDYHLSLWFLQETRKGLKRKTLRLQGFQKPGICFYGKVHFLKRCSNHFPFRFREYYR
jgi:hypothetical protein